MFNSFTVITTADPDKALLADFAARLIEEGDHLSCRVTLIIVDTMATYHCAPEFLETLAKSNPRFTIKWRSCEKIMNKSKAMEAALQWADDPPVIFMDPDMAGNLSDIRRFFQAHSDGYEMVFAWRVTRKGVLWWRKLLTTAFSFSVRQLLRLPVHDINAPMVSLSGNALNLFSSMRHRLDARISSRLGGCRALGDWVAEVPISTTEIMGRASTFSYGMLIKVGASWFKDIVLYWRYEKKLFSRNQENDL